MKSLRFYIVDVFTGSLFAGNQLAVFPNARNLSSTTMQSIAAEFGFSETTFVLPASSADKTADVRIFTPQGEMDFAGHPNVGTAYVLSSEEPGVARIDGDELFFEEKGGSIAVKVLREKGVVVGAEIEAPQGLSILDRLTAEQTALALRLAPGEVLTSRIEPTVASVGYPCALAELSELDALGRAEPNLERFREASRRNYLGGNTFAIYAFVVTSVEPVPTLRARLFCPLDSPPEDPGTGSAGAVLGAVLSSPRLELGPAIEITQGVEMGRPCRMTVEMPRSGGANARPKVTGRCVLVARGELFL